ncbi:glutathione S-transferase theta-1 [Prorops nasuta]|uniref:glutathione S-transferase theta-1 n=1 Tax=Prorops nasuta TaxID=863751 RepID=UPI0034CFB909
MSLKLYYDLMSQPSRALYIFLKVTNIPFEKKPVDLKALAHRTPEFEAINPFQKVPVIDNNGFKLTESIAILRYLCREFDVQEHWYPKLSEAQARVDEYLEWQHLNTRLHCASYFIVKFLTPKLSGKPPKAEKLAQFENRMSDCLDQIENIWLKERPFLIGDQISVADLVAACEIEQPRMAGFEPRTGRPRLTAWMERVQIETNPYYDEAHKILNLIANKNQGQIPQTLSRL